jgi:uncharacterized membrane protein YkoI
MTVGYIHLPFRRAGRGCGMTRKSTFALAVAFALALAVLGGGIGASAGRAAEADAHPEGHPEAHLAIKRPCLAQNETREEIKERHFLEPYAVLKSAAAEFKAEALSAKLCHLGDEFVYEITLLHRDGRLVHAVMSASSGKLLNVRNAHEPAASATHEPLPKM